MAQFSLLLSAKFSSLICASASVCVCVGLCSWTWPPELLFPSKSYSTPDLHPVISPTTTTCCCRHQFNSPLFHQTVVMWRAAQTRRPNSVTEFFLSLFLESLVILFAPWASGPYTCSPAWFSLVDSCLCASPACCRAHVFVFPPSSASLPTASHPALSLTLILPLMIKDFSSPTICALLCGYRSIVACGGHHSLL